MDIVQPAKLRRGTGNGDPTDGLCIMQMVDWFSGSNNVSDRPVCASPAMSMFAIYLNDNAPSQTHRDQLWPLTWLLLDSADPPAEQPRAAHLKRDVYRKLVEPVACQLRFLRASTSDVYVEADAESLIRFLEISNMPARCSAEVSQAINSVTLIFTDFRIHLLKRKGLLVAPEWESAWCTCRQILIDAIHLGKHGEEDPVYVPRAEELHRIIEEAPVE